MTRRGQSLVEFALVLPVLVVLLLAVFDVGRIVFAYNSLTNATREAVRVAIVNQDVALVRQRGLEQIAVADTDSASLTLSFYKAVPDADPTRNATCTTLSAGCVAVVSFETTMRPITPVISQIVFPRGVTLRATSMLPVEYVCPNADVTSSAQCPRQP